MCSVSADCVRAENRHPICSRRPREGAAQAGRFKFSRRSIFLSRAWKFSFPLTPSKSRYIHVMPCTINAGVCGVTYFENLSVQVLIPTLTRTNGATADANYRLYLVLAEIEDSRQSVAFEFF